MNEKIEFRYGKSFGEAIAACVAAHRATGNTRTAEAALLFGMAQSGNVEREITLRLRVSGR